MKNLTKLNTFLMFLALSFAQTAMAKATISDDILFTNKDFAQKLFEVLEKNIEPTRIDRMGGSSEEIRVADALSCSRHSAMVSGGHVRVTGHECSILRTSAWNENGMKGSYVNKDPRVVTAIFSALNSANEKREPSNKPFITSRSVGSLVGNPKASYFSCSVVDRGSEDLEKPSCILYNNL